MKAEIVKAEAAAPAVRANAIELVAVEADVLLARRQAVERVVAEVMVPDVHFGQIPGVKGKSLLKPGTEVLAASFQLGLDYEIETLPDEDGRRYVVKALVTHQPTGAYLGSGMGECSTNETKWKWRGAHTKEAEATPADRRREKFTRDGKKYWQVRQETADVGNTALKQACKRAAADAVLAVLGVRGMVLDSELSPGAQAAPKPAGEAAVAELVRFAALKGVVESRLLSTLKRDGYSGRLEDISTADYGYLAAELFILPDKVDAVTGEVVDPQHGHHPDDIATGNLPTDGERAVDGDDDIGFEGEDAPSMDGL